MKRIDLYVLRNFFTLFLATFFICSFILIMQFLWLRIGELVGKGLDVMILLRFFFHSWLSLVPMALPLAILLASLMAFGDMGERLELLAMKSAGISLFRIMRSLVVAIVVITIGAFIFSNNVIPVSQKQMWNLLDSIRKKSPELNVPVGEFYTGIDKMHLYVRSKNHDTGALVDVMVYDFSSGFKNASVTTADTAYILATADKMNLQLIFINGETFENLEKDKAFDSKNVPYRRESFKRREVLLDFDTNFKESDGAWLDVQHVSKDIVQLTSDIDSINQVRDSLRVTFANTMVQDKYFASAFEKVDTLNAIKDTLSYDYEELFLSTTQAQKVTISGKLMSRIKSVSSDLNYNNVVIRNADNYYNKHSVEWHRKFTLPFACFIFFFIGAPLGAIIRKGGLGMPVVISVVMFIVYYIIDTTGVKMAREAIWPVWQGMWLSSMVLLPIGIFLTVKAANDSVLFNSEEYVKVFGRIKKYILNLLTRKNKTN